MDAGLRDIVRGRLGSDLRKRAGIPETVSALRVCDIVLWMAHAEDHKARRCPGHGTLSV